MSAPEINLPSPLNTPSKAKGLPSAACLESPLPLRSPREVDFMTYQRAAYSGVLLPGFQQTDDDARTLMSLLYNKICVERRHSDHDLFLQCDEDRSGKLSVGDFCTAMEKVGIPLREDQVAWLFQQFDLHRDGELDFDEFTRMLTAWRRSELSAGGEGPSSPVGFKEEGRTEDKTLGKEQVALAQQSGADISGEGDDDLDFPDLHRDGEEEEDGEAPCSMQTLAGKTHDLSTISSDDNLSEKLGSPKDDSMQTPREREEPQRPLVEVETRATPPRQALDGSGSMRSPTGLGFTSYSNAMYSDLFLPTVDHSHFKNDLNAQKSLLTMLYNKLCIEHRHTYHDLFLSFDHDRKTVLSMKEFQAALDRVGLPVVQEHVEWLMEYTDCGKDGKIAYEGFTKILKAIMAPQTSPAGPDHQARGEGRSPWTESDEIRERNKKEVYEEWRKALSPRGKVCIDKDVDIPQVLHQVAEAVYSRDGGVKKLFKSWDRDCDCLLSKDELAEGLESLGFMLSGNALEDLFQVFDVDGDGSIRFWEFTRILSSVGSDEVNSAGIEVEPHHCSTVPTSPPHLPTASLLLPVSPGKPRLSEDGFAGGGWSDAEVLAEVGCRLYDRGISSHRAIKELAPMSGGSVDGQGLQTLFEQVGVKIDQERADRLMAMGTQRDRLAAWELVRLLTKGYVEHPVSKDKLWDA